MSEFHLPGCNSRGEFRRVFDYFDRIACLGRKEDAINEGKKAVELSPESEDAVEGPKATAPLAEIYASVGEHDKAHLLAVPNGLTVPQLRLDPVLGEKEDLSVGLPQAVGLHPVPLVPASVRAQGR